MSIPLDQAVTRALPGATDHGDGAVSFALYAPGKDGVKLLGDFDAWSHSGQRMLQREPGFWVTARELPRGKARYQFLIDDQLVICDPYAQEIEPAEGKDASPRAIIDVGRPIYQWQHDDFIRPRLRDLIIYELHVGDFTPQGTFQGVVDRLDYIAELGVNAIEFMPLCEGAPSGYWGYEPTYELAPRREYGSPEDLLRMVDECHARGIAVILDVVLAHTGHSHPFMAMYPYEQSPWYGEGIGEPNQFGLPTLDFTKGPTNGFVRDLQAYWLRVFHVDGFRYDYLVGLGADDQGHGIPYLMRTAREIRPEAYLIGEALPERPDLVNGSGLGAVWHARSRIALEALLRESAEVPYTWDNFAETVSAFDPATQGYDCPEFMVNYLECHDDIRVIHALRQHGFPDEVAFAKAALGATILMTIPGEPMLYAGGEWGEDHERSQAVHKLNWAALETEPGRGLCEHYRKMCRLHRERVSTRHGSMHLAAVDPQAKTLVYHRVSGEADQLVVVANFSGQPRKIEVPFPSKGPWHEYATTDIFNVDGPQGRELPAYTAVVYANGVS